MAPDSRSLSPLSLAAVAAASTLALTPSTRAQGAAGDATVQLVEATVRDLQGSMQSGLLSAEGLAGRYAARVAAYDQTGPDLKALIGLNPNLVDEARQRDRDARNGAPRGPLFGIPILLKDNVDALPMPTTAGALALQNSMPPDDAFLVQKLRAAGAVVLGKASLTEFANFFTTGANPNGYSFLGGHGVNAYDTRRQGNGFAVVQPGGSSSGSGIAVSSNLASVAIGTETSGSILSPSSTNGVVGIKPTVGLVSRDGIVPITADQDTAGPIARTVEDAAIVLGVIAGFDPNDPATAPCQTPGNCFSDYTQFLDRGALQGARIAVPPSPFRLNAEQRRIMNQAIASMRAAGATVVENYRLPSPSVGNFAVSYPPPAGSSTVLIFGMKRDLDAYLASLGPTAPMQSLAQIVQFNLANPSAVPFGQTILQAADRYDPTPNSPDDLRYQADLLRDRTQSRLSLDAGFAGPDGQAGTADDFDTLIYPANFGANIPARAGYPSIVVPAGFQAQPSTPALPFGITFTGPAFSEPRLIALAYAFEQATLHRTPPAPTPALSSDTIPLGLPGILPYGFGCPGSNGTPAIASAGPPIIGHGAFAIRLSSLRVNAPAFLGISTRRALQPLGFCTLQIGFPFNGVLMGMSDGNGDADIELPIPFDPALVGLQAFVQGGALDPNGFAVGVASVSPGLEITIGG